ncbi:MAG: peptide ABC transporter substrate-binding protein [Acidobacteriota bacterium]|nr:peptide ABC transporter substrate-binding protein [Acidobacteriota bacterium]
MARIKFFSRVVLPILALSVSSIFISGCASSAGSSRYFGKTQPPKENVLRYISGSEPESLDPHQPSGQPETRVLMALYDGLVEYHPKTMEPIPAIAKSWEISPNVDEFIFYLRRDAKWSDGTPITARDFLYSFRRGFAPETASRTASLGYFIKYAEAFNGEQVFVKKNDRFLLAKDFAKKDGDAAPPQKTDDSSRAQIKPAAAPSPAATAFGAETEFHKFIKSPDRLVLDGSEKKRAKQIEANPALKAALAEGAQFVPVKAEDIGVEMLDDYTLRITLRQPAPFFLGLLAHQFFRLVPQHAIEKHDKNWTRAENIVTCGAFKVKKIYPYDAYIFEKDQNYWDAANVRLDGIEFYPVEEQTTILNLYKAGNIDAMLNHIVPASWLDVVRDYKDEYLNFPENATAYYSMNVTKPPFDNRKVRQAFSLAINRELLAQFRKTTKPLYFQTPSGIFPDYDKAMDKVGEEVRKERGISPEDWAKQRKQFDPELARKLLAEAGFPMRQNGGAFSFPTFPADKVAISYNTLESNRQVAEFIQAQWKQNLGITIPLKNMEFKTFLPYRNSLQYEGFVQSLWGGDYMDPFTFLGLHYGQQNDGGSGFFDSQYDRMLDEANNELDPQKRYEKLARAEYYLMEQLPSVPLTVAATNWLKKPYVKGLYPNPGTLHAWKFVYIERDPAKWDRDVENIMQEKDAAVEEQLNKLLSTQVQTKSE